MNKRMRILITGASGLIGAAITRRLQKEGHDIVATYNTRKLEIPVKWVNVDFSNDEVVAEILNKLGEFDVLVHSAAVVREGVNAMEYKEVLKINIEFTNRLFDWAKENVSNCIIYTSGFNFIRRPLPSIITERSEINPETLYGFSKYSGEKYLRFPDFSKIRAISLRLPSPVTDNFNLMPNTVVKKWLNSAFENKKISVWGRGVRRQNFVFTEDVAQAVHNAIINSTANGVYNIASANNISMRDLACLIAKKTGAEIEYTGVDPFEDDSWNISIEKAITELGYNPQYDSATSIQKLLENI